MNLIREIKLNNTWLLSGRLQKGSDVAAAHEKKATTATTKNETKTSNEAGTNKEKKKRNCTMFAYQIVYILQARISEYQIVMHVWVNLRNECESNSSKYRKHTLGKRMEKEKEDNKDVWYEENERQQNQKSYTRRRKGKKTAHTHTHTWFAQRKIETSSTAHHSLSASRVHARYKL